MMNKVLGICNLHDSPSLGKLTKTRPLGALSFLSRFGLMDFTLSNFSNSEIDRVIILTESNASAVTNHTGQGNVWINNTRTGFLKILMNEKLIESPKFNTDIKNIEAHYSVIEDINPEYIVVAPTFFLMSIDFREVIEAHEESGAEATMVYLKTKKEKSGFMNCDSMIIEKNGVVSHVDTVVKEMKGQNISLETFIFTRESFDKTIATAKKVSALYGIRKALNYAINHHRLIVNAYQFDGYVVPIMSSKDFIDRSFDLLAYENRSQLFNDNWPIYTTTHNTPPAFYGNKANVMNSIVGNGAIIKGTVENSIISRDVVVEEGAVVRNCILFTQTYVGKNKTLEYVLTDKNVKVVEVKELKGKKDDVLYVKQGETV